MTQPREVWLEKARDLIAEKVFAPAEVRLPPLVKVSCGPCPGKALAICCSPETSDDGSVQIFVSPQLGSDDTMVVLGALVHEMVHAHCYGEGHLDHGHGFPFSKVIRDVGLSGKPKYATAHEGTELHTTLEGFAAELGPYPHKPLRKREKKSRKSEFLTWISEANPDYELKIKFSVSYENGVPRDPAGVPMIPKDKQKFSEKEAEYLEGAGSDDEGAEDEQESAE